jgi:hypothetical protein|tara:strand:- start:3736 stop:3990 length:255 start_codon:yes stop_codon:yes gene_type:complete
MADLLVRRKEDFVIEWSRCAEEGSFTAAGDDHFTVDNATSDWGLPNPGWDNLSREGIAGETAPDGYQPGVSKLLGTAGNYTWEV